MKKIQNALWQLLEWFLFFGTVFMVVLVFINVVARYVFSYTFVSFEEIARILFVWCTYLGAAEAIKEGTHIRVDIFINALSPMARKVVAIIANLFVDFALVITIKVMMKLIIVNISNPLPLTRIPYGVVQAIIPASMVIMLAVNILKLFQIFRKQPVSDQEGGETI
ncbi:MAG: TRAP transporter small permease [Oscillospiraceae bacterium]